MKKYRNTIEFEVYGPYALFSDPVMRVGGEKTSYHIPTYEALRGIVESIYWKPTIMWIVDAVRVMNPIQTETKGIRPIAYNGGNELAYYTYLKDVRYQVRAHFEINYNHTELKDDRNEYNIIILPKGWSSEADAEIFFLEQESVRLLKNLVHLAREKAFMIR